MLKHGDLVGAVVTYPSVMTRYGETHAGLTTDHYDTRGRRVLSTELATDAFGAVVSRGRAVATTVEQDYDGDGAVETVVRGVTTYDAKGNVLRDAATYSTLQGGVRGSSAGTRRTRPSTCTGTR